MPEDLRFALYDTWQPGTTANAEAILFQVASGGDATHNEQFTNMRGAGSLPSAEKFVVDKISLVIDVKVVIADVTKLPYGGILEVRVADFSRIKAPLQLFFNQSAWGGALVEAAAADTPTVGLLGNGYELDKPIELGGGIPFKVRLVQGVALSVATNVKVVLEGIYTVASVQ